jgi:hypothetical protein
MKKSRKGKAFHKLMKEFQEGMIFKKNQNKCLILQTISTGFSIQ